METIIAINCPHCDKPLPDKVGDIDVEYTNNFSDFIGYTCSGCHHTLTSEDISVINAVFERQVKEFEDEIINSAFK